MQLLLWNAALGERSADQGGGGKEGRDCTSTRLHNMEHEHAQVPRMQPSPVRRPTNLSFTQP